MEEESVCARLREAIELRKRYHTLSDEPRHEVPATFSFGEDGLVHVRARSGGEKLCEVPSLAEYYHDMTTLFQTRTSGPVNSFCLQRLRLLQTKFELYMMVSGDAESLQAMQTGHRDFYNVRKVDTHVHHSAAMNAKHLLRFMKKKMKQASGDVVDKDKEGKPRTLGQVFQAMGIAWTDLCIDRLQVWADKSCMHRFDRFNNKYSPMGHNDLRTIFLKTDNAMGGRYLAEITRELIDNLEESKYQHAEWRLSIYGRKRDEWDNLSCWVLGVEKGLGDGRALLSEKIRWMIQIPRLFNLYKASGQLSNFGEMLENIFVPMFEATCEPEAHPHVSRFLEHVSGFDSVDDESKSDNPVQRTFSSKERTPREWDLADNPSYKYYSYFIHANLKVLNKLRSMRGLNQFAYRPHAGEAGEVHHLDTAFLLADGINHGVNLRKSPVLQYLFYVTQIGVAMSPCSNNQLFLEYDRSPFPTYFARGLNVSLSTDDPLMFHQTKEPLLEEYSIASQIWHFNSVDLCEIARNSVIQSGFSEETKASWLGTPNFRRENCMKSTNVPEIRVAFRRQLHGEELRALHRAKPAAEDSLCQMLLNAEPQHVLSTLDSGGANSLPLPSDAMKKNASVVGIYRARSFNSARTEAETPEGAHAGLEEEGPGGVRGDLAARASPWLRRRDSTPSRFQPLEAGTGAGEAPPRPGPGLHTALGAAALAGALGGAALALLLASRRPLGR